MAAVRPTAQGMRFGTRNGAADGRRRRVGVWRRVLAVLAAIVVTFCAVTARLFVWPAQGMPARVSAIVMLAGPGDRLPVALEPGPGAPGAGAGGVARLPGLRRPVSAAGTRREAHLF